MSNEPVHMWRGVILWERPDGSRFAKHFPPRLSKAAANGDVTRNVGYSGRNRFVLRRVERTLLIWHTVEVDGESV